MAPRRDVPRTARGARRGAGPRAARRGGPTASDDRGPARFAIPLRQEPSLPGRRGRRPLAARDAAGGVPGQDARRGLRQRQRSGPIRRCVRAHFDGQDPARPRDRRAAALRVHVQTALVRVARRPDRHGRGPRDRPRHHRCEARGGAAPRRRPVPRQPSRRRGPRPAHPSIDHPAQRIRPPGQHAPRRGPTDEPRADGGDPALRRADEPPHRGSASGGNHRGGEIHAGAGQRGRPVDRRGSAAGDRACCGDAIGPLAARDRGEAPPGPMRSRSR